MIVYSSIAYFVNECKSIVNASEFGLSADAADNTQAMRDAFTYCRNHPGTKLVIDPGIYHFSPEEDIYLNRLHDVLIDAQGAEFIFSTPHYFKLYACDNVELRNMVVDWDWNTLRLGSIVKIDNENDADNTLEIEFTELKEVDADIPRIRIRLTPLSDSQFLYWPASRCRG